MARLHRPYIPMSVRVKVAERQVEKTGHAFWPLYLSGIQSADRMGVPWSLTRKLRVLLHCLFPHGGYQLDHDPALENRQYKEAANYYYPDANDLDHLVYRSKAAHLFKTTGRRPDAERTVTSKGSDNWIAKKFRRLERKTKASKRPKQKIRSRGFQKGKRKINVRQK